MKLKTINFTFICDKNWEEMAEINGCERHCTHCSKNIIDFDAMTDEEVIHYFTTKAKAKPCGKMTRHKLNNINLLLASQFDDRKQHYNLFRSHTTSFFLGSAMAFFTLTSNNTKAQTDKNVAIESYQMKEKGKVQELGNNNFIFKGIVKDESNEPIIFTPLMTTKNGKQFMVTETDIEGRFELSFHWETNCTYVILVEYVGYKSLTYTLDRSKSKDTLVLKEQEGLMGEIVITGIVAPQNDIPDHQTWYQRFGNWFKKW